MCQCVVVVLKRVGLGAGVMLCVLVCEGMVYRRLICGVVGRNMCAVIYRERGIRTEL